MPEHHDHPHTSANIGVPDSFRHGPLDAAGFLMWVPADQDLTDLRDSLPTEDGYRDLYHYDGRPDPDSREVLLRHIGVVGFVR